MTDLTPSALTDVAVTETHISVLVFLGDRVYKLKKPVAFPFVDLTSRESHEQLCHREVELNRRLAPDVYLGVLDVTGPDGQAVDHLVAMRRMPSARRLSSLVAAGDESVTGTVSQLGQVLAEFHRTAARSPAIDAVATPGAIERLWGDNVDELRSFVGPVLDPVAFERAHRLAVRFLAGRDALFEARIAGGAICDGHGDLQADDIFCLDDGPRVLDCIEFRDEFRYGDVANDVAFLVMDLERLGAADHGGHLVHAYEAAAGAPLPPSLVRFYVAYRALVRAKIACLRASQEDPGSAGRVDAHGRARQLLGLAVESLEAATVRLILVGGLPGTGKSTLATDLGSRRGWSVLRSDVVRKQLAGLSPTESAAAEFGAGLYSPDHTEGVYDALVDQARGRLQQGQSVVVDASFNEERPRRLMRDLADDTASDLVELCCVLDPGEAARRIGRRRERGGDASDADARVARAMAARADPWPQALIVSTASGAAAVTAETLERLALDPPDNGGGEVGR